MCESEDQTFSVFLVFEEAQREKVRKLSVDRPSNLQLRKILDEIEMHDYARISGACEFRVESIVCLNFSLHELTNSRKRPQNRYAKMIKEPMDLGTIRQRMENFEYIAEDGGVDAIEGAKRFVKDLLLLRQLSNLQSSGFWIVSTRCSDVEFCRVDLLGSYGEGKIRKQAVYGKKKKMLLHHMQNRRRRPWLIISR